MNAIEPRRVSSSPAVVGLVLVTLGLVALVVRQTGVDVFELVGDAGWPFFVIVPGLVLLAASLVAPVPAGLGLAIAGAVVTTVGGILLYQQSTGHWESWAYAWALIPAGSGIAMIAYGLIFGRYELLANGARQVVIAGALFAAGFWFFETIFDTGRAPVDLGTWWPALVVALGVLVIVVNLFFPDRAATAEPGDGGLET